MTDNHIDVLINGCGIGGAMLAYLLGRQGHRVVVVEQARRERAINGADLLKPAGIRVVEAAGLLAEVTRRGGRVRHELEVYHDGELLRYFNYSSVDARGYFILMPCESLRRLVLATNENNVLEEFFTTGIYRPRSAEDTLATSSPSMDISKASNLERFIWALLGPEVFVQRWTELETTGTLDLRDQLPRLREEFGFVAGTSTHADRLEAIRSVKERSGRLIDPHTADGVTVALRVMEPGFPTLVMETAKAAKFPQTVAEALGSEPETPDVVADLLARPQKVETIDNQEAPLRVLIEERALNR